MSGPGLTAQGLMADWIIPRGDNYFNAPIVMSDQTGVTWRGYGGIKVSRLIYVGPPTEAFIQIIGSSRNCLKDFEIVIARPGVKRALLITNNPGGTAPSGRVSTANLIQNVRVPFAGGHSPEICFDVDSTALGGLDGNNDHHDFIRCDAKNYSAAAYHIKGSQCHDLLYSRCHAADYGGRKPIGVHAEDGVFFTWYRGAMNRNSIDFKLGSAEIQTVIDGHNSENSEQFLAYNRPNGMPNISVRDVRWEGNTSAQNPAVEVAASGPIKLDNVYLSGLQGICPRMVFGGTMGSVDLSGVTIRQYGGTIPASPIISAGPGVVVRQHGLLHHVINSDGSRTLSPIAVNVAQVA